jgi:hypothetical protein
MLKITNLAAIFPVLFVAACGGEPSPPPFPDPPVALDQSPAFDRPRPAGPLGIDLSIDASDVLNELKDSRVDFVARYYRDPVSALPSLSPAEAQRLSSLGLKIVAVWERSSPDPQYLTYSYGYRDAMMAYRQAIAIGQPPGSAIYFAIDLNTHRLDAVVQYFRGVAAGLAAAGGGVYEYQVGVYGSGAVCDAVKGAGLAQYSWLSNSTSWAGSLDYDGWNIKQGEALDGLSFDNDSDEARGEYGGFRLRRYDIAAPRGL